MGREGNRCRCSKWLLRNAQVVARTRVPGWDAESFAAAVTYGSLKVLTWMHENGCPWDEDATEQAAMDDNLEILTWLHENGCPISEGACFEAVDNIAWECLKYLVDNKCPNWETT